MRVKSCILHAETHGMKQVLPSGLRPRLLLLIAFTVSASMALLFASALREQSASLRAAGAEAALLARLAAAHEEGALTDARQLLREIDRLGLADVRRSAATSRLLKQRLAEVTTIASLAAATPQGRVFATTDSALLGTDVRTAGWFQRALARRAFVVENDPAHGRAGRAWMRCAAPVFGADGRVRAILCATLDAGWLRRAAMRAHLPKETVLLVIDRDGAVIAQQPQGGRADSVIAQFKPRPGDGQRIVRGGDGVARIVAFAPLEGARERMLYVGVGVRRDAVLASARQTFARDMALMLLVALVIGAIAWRGVEMIVLRRVQALLTVMAALRRGDLSARTSLPYGRSELSRLSEDFDQMAIALERQRTVREQAEERLRLSEARKRAVLESVLDAIVIANGGGRVLECNASARALFGIAAPYADHHVASLVDLPRLGFTGVVGVAVPSAGRFETDGRHADGSTFAAEVSVAPIRDPDAQGLFVLTVRDISDRRRWQQTLEEESHRDELTGLLNRRGFRTLAEQQIKMAERQGRSVVIVSVDLDGLKHINDQFGHAEGDRAIVELAAALHDSFRETDLIARLGGDEFVVFASESEHLGAEKSLDRLAARIAARDAQLARPWRLSASFGWLRTTPEHDTRLDVLLREADERMYARKRHRGLSRDAIAGPGGRRDASNAA